jgi:hypothetical protein
MTLTDGRAHLRKNENNRVSAQFGAAANWRSLVKNVFGAAIIQINRLDQR